MKFEEVGSLLKNRISDDNYVVSKFNADSLIFSYGVKLAPLPGFVFFREVVTESRPSWSSRLGATTGLLDRF